ncbi:MAG: ribulose-phosphate 3-epimerase [Candidatus Midichloriaceae bacterium]
MKKNKISASILAANFAILREEIKSISDSGADSIHLDIMDGHFVPNISFGPDIVKAIKKESTIPLKTHLMINNPEKYIDEFIEAGSDMIIFHQETVIHCDRLVDYIKDKGVKVGISIIPSTHESVLEYIYEKLDEILVMTVNPGFGGQKFLSSQLKKIHNLSIMTSKMADIDIGVDGGINPDTLKKCAKNGANLAIAGNYIFKGNEYKLKVDELKKSFKS